VKWEFGNDRAKSVGSFFREREVFRRIKFREAAVSMPRARPDKIVKPDCAN
jgi:hypothetical protein